jgi:flagellum-specific ATP synthase
MLDSVTRFAMALREIGLAAGEPPASKGYTPSVFGELPQVLERAGPGTNATAGDITGLFTVLVEGDDHSEPIADAVRGILDGHIVLDRQIAERGRYPAVNVLRSISRTMPACNTEQQTELVQRARRLLSTYEDMGELIRIGAYKKGSDPKVDEAIQYVDRIESFLHQDKRERTSLDEGYAQLARVLDMPWGDAKNDPNEAGGASGPAAGQENQQANAQGNQQGNAQGGGRRARRRPRRSQ